jgi:hypothetical protein
VLSKRRWLCAANTNSGQVHRTVRWCTRQCPVRQAGRRWTGRSREKAEAYDYNSPDCPVVHQTVWWANGRQRQRSATRSADDVWPTATVGWAHQTVRCANRPRGPTVECAKFGRRLRTEQLQWLSGGAPDYPLHHPTEGKFGLPSWPPTAPSCLGAIKGTPRCMEKLPKLTRNILRLPDFDSMHLILCVSDLSSIWVANSVCCASSSSCDLCAWLCCGFETCVCCSPNLTPCFLCDLYCKGERLQFVEIPCKREQYSKGKDRGIQVDHRITWKGLSATLVHWDATTWK